MFFNCPPQSTDKQPSCLFLETKGFTCRFGIEWSLIATKLSWFLCFENRHESLIMSQLIPVHKAICYVYLHTFIYIYIYVLLFWSAGNNFFMTQGNISHNLSWKQLMSKRRGMPKKRRGGGMLQRLWECVPAVGWMVFPQNSYTENLTPRTSEYDLIWSLYRANQVQIVSWGWAPTQCDWCPYKEKKFRHRQRHIEGG